MVYLTIIWIIAALVPFVLLGKTPKGIYLYAAIGAFAGAITAALGAPFGFQAITAVHTGVLYLLITETGIENFFWIVIVLSELLFFGVYYI
ncbi:MAG: hypothetical protein KAI53_01860 [Candidatus Aenigmarchaeota archaeon]|nr:hypothetical protein [Candidatus Aenigmarchaeota archaeon]